MDGEMAGAGKERGWRCVESGCSGEGGREKCTKSRGSLSNFGRIYVVSGQYMERCICLFRYVF